MKKRNGFTIIELIVVLVILAIICLITVPVVLNVIDKAKETSNKRSVDGYGEAIELAQSTYKLENGKYTYNFDDLDVKYTGISVECDEIVLNENGSVFVSKCKIDDEYVEDETTDDGYYQYGDVIFDYEVGELINYNNVDYYVVKNSLKTDEYITLLKSDPITTQQAMKIASATGIENNLNYYNGYLNMQYFYNEQCIYRGDTSGCTTDYNLSSVKQIVDAWTAYYTNENDLVKDDLGYKARILTKTELTTNLDCGDNSCPTSKYNSWLYNSKYSYWIVSSFDNSNSDVYGMNSIGYTNRGEYIVSSQSGVRPVINLKKSVIEE